MNLKGIFFTVASATLFGTAPAIVQKAYTFGSNAETVTFFRNFFAIPIVLIIMYTQKIGFHITKKQLQKIILISIFGLGATTLMLVSSYPYIGTSMATTLHFLYPVFVALFCLIFFREKISKGKWLALLAAILGILFFFQKGSGNHVALGIFLSVTSGATYAFYLVGLDKFDLRNIHPMTLTFYISLCTAIGLLLYATPTQKIHFIMPANVWLLLFLNAIIASFLAVALLQIGIRYLSATSVAIFSLFEPVTSNLIGILFMGEEISLKKIIGSIIILGAAGAMALLERPPKPTEPSVP